jgi:hypothetical protein
MYDVKYASKFSKSVFRKPPSGKGQGKAIKEFSVGVTIINILVNNSKIVLVEGLQGGHPIGPPTFLTFLNGPTYHTCDEFYLQPPVYPRRGVFMHLGGH